MYSYQTRQHGKPCNFYHTEYSFVSTDAYAEIRSQLDELQITCDIVVIDQWTDNYNDVEMYEIVLHFTTELDYSLFLLASSH